MSKCRCKHCECKSDDKVKPHVVEARMIADRLGKYESGTIRRILKAAVEEIEQTRSTDIW